MRKVSMMTGRFKVVRSAEFFAGVRVEGAEGEETEGEGDKEKVVHDGVSIAPRRPRA